MNLYEINVSLEHILNQLNEYMEGRDGDPEGFPLNSELDAIQASFWEKVKNIGLAVKNYRATIKALKEEESALKSRRQRAENQVEWLLSYLESNIQNPEAFSLKDPKVEIKFRRSESVQVDSDAILPDEFTRVIPEVREPDKKLLHAALALGREVGGVDLVKNWNVQVK